MTGLKIAFLTEFFYPHIGGCETRFFEIGRRLVDRGHDVHVFTIQFDRNLAKEEEICGIKVNRYAYSRSYISQDSFRSFRGIANYSFASLFKLQASKFDIYYSNQWPMLHSLFVKPVVSPLIQEWCEVWDNPLKVRLMQKMLRHVGDYHVAVSEFTKQRLMTSLKIDGKKIFLVPNGVDSARFASSAKKVWGRIVYAGRIVPHKRVEMLVEAFRAVKEKVPQAELHIVGSGLSLESIKERAAGIKDCYVHGFLPEKQMIELVKSSWLFVLPSEREGSGIAAMEAMAAGVPFVTLDYPNNAAKEFCRFNCGLVVAPLESSVAQAIIRLFGDETTWQALSSNALNVARGHDWDMVTDRMEDFFNMVVTESGK
ncbi:MAG: glycosyltransferase family 4 protein [Candidatus Bathyarchaeota archaeon]|nr:glycosyltransferase family 4 protein [Candidatus Bathyarchaeota archaeon]